MTTFVLVHGGWGGGWEWTPVAGKLRERGYQVFTPTLTGLGERKHLLPSEVTLSDHIRDVLAVFEFEELSDVILCGHSYSGMVVTGVADRIPERIQLLAYPDSFAPKDGESLYDQEPDFTAALLQRARDRGDNRTPIPSELLPPLETADETITQYIARLRPQSANTFTEPLRLSGAIEQVPRAYVLCTGYQDSVMGRYAERARAEGWLYRELPTEHDLQLFDPDGTVEVLEDLAKAAGLRFPDGSGAGFGS